MPEAREDMKLSDEEFTKAGGVRCPRCGKSTTRRVAPMNVVDNEAWAVAVCYSCELVYHELYSLIGYDFPLAKKGEG